MPAMRPLEPEPIVVQYIRAEARRRGRLQDVARAAGLAPSTLSAVMGRHSKLSATACVRLADVIGADLLAVIEEFGSGPPLRVEETVEVNPAAGERGVTR